MKKLICTIMLALTVTSGVSAQLVTEREPVAHLRGCRVGTPNPHFKPRRALSLQGGENPYVGDRRQLVVLVSFQDLDFAEDHEGALQKWGKIFNAENYAEGRFVGSIHDYFMAQSYGQFNLKFDLLFVELPDGRSKYCSTYSDDENSQYMVDDIVDVLQTQGIDWSLYDWNGDSFVDQLLIIYAGQGMNAGGGPNTIWPHQWWMSQHENLETEDPDDYRSYRTVVQGDKEYYIDCYCCLQEYVAGNPPRTPFGTICHEYTHCFGFPDLYYNTGTKVLGYWDLMDSGNYNGEDYRPCNYSAHERMLMGWLTPVELTSSTIITDMPALVDEPVAYLIRNDGMENEYYIVENRQQRGWDEDLPGSGIVVSHIDYDKDLWISTTESVNSSSEKHYQIIPANNRLGVSASSGWAYPYVMKDIHDNDSIANDSLTNTSRPAATLYNPNVDGKLLMSKPITCMAVDANGLASFLFMYDSISSVREVPFYQEWGHDTSTPIYDLQGRRLSAPAKGPYIQGKKLRIKK
jgi:M6 family metalloprotease-like protein